MDGTHLCRPYHGSLTIRSALSGSTAPYRLPARMSSEFYVLSYNSKLRTQNLELLLCGDLVDALNILDTPYGFEILYYTPKMFQIGNIDGNLDYPFS